MDNKLKLNIKFNRARYNLMFMILLSAINMYFLLKSENFYLPFSSSISSYSIVLGLRASADLGSNAFKIVGIALACVALTVYLICYLKSKKNAFFLFMSFTLFIADTVALIVITIAFQSFGALSVIDILLHLMTLFFLWSGINADAQLRRIRSSGTIEPSDNNDNGGNNTDEAKSTTYEYIDNGETPLLYGNYNNNRVFAVKKGSIAELVVNDIVLDRLDIAYLSEYELKATVDEVEFNFQYRSDYNGEAMYLYADDVLLDSLTKE